MFKVSINWPLFLKVWPLIFFLSFSFLPDTETRLCLLGLWASIFVHWLFTIQNTFILMFGGNVSKKFLFLFVRAFLKLFLVAFGLILCIQCKKSQILLPIFVYSIYLFSFSFFIKLKKLS